MEDAITLIRQIQDYLKRNGEEGVGECFYRRLTAVVKQADERVRWTGVERRARERRLTGVQP